MALRFFSIVAISIFIHVTCSRLVPYRRSNKELVPASTESSILNGGRSGLLCGVGGRGDWEDEYQIEVKDQGGLRSFYEEREPQIDVSDQSKVRVASRRFQRLTLSRSNLRALCPNQHMLQAISRSGDRLELTCSRLRQHLRKGNKRGFVLLRRHALSRMSNVNERGAGNESGVVLKGRAEREVGIETMDETYMCGTSFYLDGVECANADCSTLKLLCVQVLVDVDLANELFCDLLRPAQGSLLIQSFRHEDGIMSTVDGSGNLFGGITRFKDTFGARLFTGLHMLVLAGVDVLGDPEWESDLIGHFEGASCPDGMFVSQVTRKRVALEEEMTVSVRSTEENIESQVIIRCSRLERNLLIGRPTSECSGSLGNSLLAQRFDCQNGYLSGLRLGDESCPRLILECRSLACQ